MEKYLIQVNHFITSLEGSYSGLGISIPNSVKHSCDFVAVSISTLQFFVRAFSKTLIVDWTVFSKAVYDTICLASWVYWECNFYVFRNAHMKFFPPLYLQSTYIKDKFLVSGTLCRHDASKASLFILALHWS